MSETKEKRPRKPRKAKAPDDAASIQTNEQDDVYKTFLRSKLLTQTPSGIENPGPINEKLFPFQRDIVRWALKRGKAAILADCGMGKTAMQLEWARHVAEHTGKPVIILAPLAVAQQTAREGEKFGITCQYVRSESENDWQIVVTNYEMMHKFDPTRYGGIVTDESSILKSLDGATKTSLIERWAMTPYKLACTATPAPNDQMEIGNHSEFLNVLSRVEMLSMFFVHDGSDSSKWRLKGHAAEMFWKWMCSWAVMIRKPSDLGYDDGAFVLPELRMHEHLTPADATYAREAGTLFAMEARGLMDRRRARRASLNQRVALCSEIVAQHPNDQWLIWGDLNAEADGIEKTIKGSVQIKGPQDQEEKKRHLLSFIDGSIRVLVTKPSVAAHGVNLQNCHRMIFVGLGDSFEFMYQAIRRCWRFGQGFPVDCHVIIGEAEGAVLQNIKRKERDAAIMVEQMVGNMRDIQRAEIHGGRQGDVDYKSTKHMTVPKWLISEPLSRSGARCAMAITRFQVWAGLGERNQARELSSVTS